jgi:polygalacturonase
VGGTGSAGEGGDIEIRSLTMKKTTVSLIVALAVGAAGAPVARSFQRAADFNVKDSGAKGDGRILDTDAINRAIAAAHASGGGTVPFPAGTYLSTSIHLQSHVGLFIDHGATIRAADAGVAPYDEPEPNAGDTYQDFGHSHWHNALLWGDGVEDVSIDGGGLIHGKGLVRNNTNVPRGSGDKAISLKNSRNIVIRDVSILHGGWVAILATGVDNFTIDNIRSRSRRRAARGAGAGVRAAAPDRLSAAEQSRSARHAASDGGEGIVLMIAAHRPHPRSPKRPVADPPSLQRVAERLDAKIARLAS